MKCGRWTLNNDAITFDKSGVLTNGQHRLTAIIKSETSQEMAVMYGVEHNINMDRPAMRSVGDNLSIFSEIFPRSLQANLLETVAIRTDSK